MKRRLALVAASALLATVGLIVPAPPVSAHTDACGGTGIGVVNQQFGLPVLSDPITTNFSLATLVSACGSGGSWTANGTMSGVCGDWVGFGTTNTGHNFSFVGIGATLVVVGEVTGVIVVTTATVYGSCTQGTFSRFYFDYAALLTH